MLERASECGSLPGGAASRGARVTDHPVLRLQQLAGNAAVARALGRSGSPPVVQRCGSLKRDCDCPAEHKAAALAQERTDDGEQFDVIGDAAPPVQRQPAEGVRRGLPGRPTVQREPPPGRDGMSFQGHYLSADVGQLRTELELLVVERGAEGAESYAYAFLRMGPEELIRLQFKGVEPELVKRVQAAFEPVVKEFQTGRKAYVGSFRGEAAAGARLVLDKSKTALENERDLYLEKDGRKPDLDGMRTAAKALAARRRSGDAAAEKARTAFTAMRTQLQQPAHPGTFAPQPIMPFFPDPALREAAGLTNEAWYREEQEYAKLRGKHEATFPALAMYAANEDGNAADRLEDLPTWGFFADSRMRSKVLEELYKRLDNNREAMDDLTDEDRVWDLPKVIDLGLKGRNAKPFEEKWVRYRAEQVQQAKADRQRLLAAITLGFAVAAGVLSLGAAAAPAAAAGTAVLAGFAAAAQAGTTALTIATAYQELMDYRFKKATSDTALDQANSLAKEDPSLLWLAVTLVGAGLEVSSLRAAFTTLREAVVAARAARNVVGLAEDAAKAGIPAAVGESIVNRVRAEIDALGPVAADPATLRATASLSSDALAKEPDLLRKEFQLAQSSSRRRVIQNDVYSEEVILENGHVWRKQRDNGHWCRFSNDPLCFIFGEGGDGHIDQFTATRTARQGTWSGEPGRSDFTPNDPVALVRAGYRPIPYRNGYPDFSEFAEGRALLPRNQYAIPDRALHERLADRALARSRGWMLPNNEPDVARAVAFRNNPADPMTWHHVEGDNVMLLVPRPIHRAGQHAGGFSTPVLP